MKNILKKNTAITVFALMAIVFMSIICFRVEPFTAEAVGFATPNYQMQFNWEKTTRTGSGGGTGESITTGTGYSVDTQVGNASTITVSVSIYGSSASGSGTFPIGSYIRSTTINLSINSEISQGGIVVTDSSGNEVGSGGKTLTLTGLSDGLYNVGFFFGSGAWATSPRSGMSVSTLGTSSFYVDTTRPTISGAAATEFGKCTNSGFYVSASDSGSGVENLYMKNPSDNVWLACGTSKTVAVGSVNGLYQFYARDNVGNTSNYNYVYFDTEKPIVKVSNGNGRVLSGSKTNSAFSAVAEDSGSGVSYIQYKLPSDTSWRTYNANSIIGGGSDNGTYIFRAVDKAGNISEEYNVFLDTFAPTGTIYVNGTAFYDEYTKSGFYYNATDTESGINRLEYKQPGMTDWIAYTGGTEISATNADGLYQFRAIDNAGNVSSVSSVYLDTVKPTGMITDASGTGLPNTTNKGFKYTATDSGSGIAYLEYKTPDDSSWKPYVSGTVIKNTETNGLYQFRAIDNARNVSDLSEIILDTEAPTGTMFGGTTIIENNGRSGAQYVKFIPTDTLSGVKNVYVKTPESSEYETYISGSQLATEGEYKFYCTDYANNSSIVYTITLDNSAPVLSCLETEFYSTYGLGFTVSVSDVSGTAKLYYKTPSSSAYQLSPTSSYYTDFDSENGKYYFFGMDDLGNTTQVYWIDLEIIYPDPMIVEYTGNSNKVKVTWTNGDYAFLNGETYVKGTWITQEGDYTIRVVNGYGLETTETFSITHNYIITSIVKPTCTTGGYTLYRCTSCGDEYIRNRKAATGHNYKEEVLEATCTTGGYVKHTCKNCGDYYETDQTQALGHKYTENTRAATCTEDGGVAHTCTVCGYEYLTETIKALGHNYVTEVSRVPHCETEGERHFHCERCAEEYYTEIPCIGHNYELSEEKTVDGKTVRTYICTNCGMLKTQDMGNEYEEVSDYMVYLIEQYEPYMLMGFLATTGIWSIVMGVFFAIAKKNDDKEKARKMIKNYLIGIVVIFVILVAAPYLIKGIAALISA